MNRHDKLMISLRYWLLGKEYYNALDALDFAPKFHQGFRKDGVTPNFQHQLEIAHYIRLFDSELMYSEETIAAGLLHDTPEDNETVEHSFIQERFGKTVGDAVFLLDKNGKDLETYHAGCATNPISSIVKPSDGINNFGSMIGVYTREKQLAKIHELENKFLPIAKKGRRSFPRQEKAYENIKFVLNSQLSMLKAINAES